MLNLDTNDPLPQPATQTSFQSETSFIPYGASSTRFLRATKLFWLISLGAWFLSGCHPDTIDNGLVPDILVSATTSAAIQTAIDAAPVTGAHLILPPGDYQATARVNLTSKDRITLDGQGKVNWIGNGSVPNLFAVLGTCHTIRLTGINFSTTAGPGTYQYGLLCAFEQSFIDGYEIDHCQFSAPNALLNLIYFLPFSPLNEGGNGRGAMQRNINIHHCVATNGGRAFCELNSHVHADGRSEVYFERFRFCHNTITNMGTQDAGFGPALSLSGMGRQVVADSNTITDTKYAGLEFVNIQQVSSTGNQFTGVQNVFSAYAFTRAGMGKNSDVTLASNSGTVGGRAYILHDTESFSITGDRFSAGEKIEVIRATNGSLNQLTMTISNDVNALLLVESQAVEVRNSTLTLTQSLNAASVIVIPASSQRIIVQDNVLTRPRGAGGNFVQSEAGSGNTIGPNIEQSL